MRKLSFFLAFAFVLTVACGAFAQYGIVKLDSVTNDYGAGTMLRAGSTHEIFVGYDLMNPLLNNPAANWIGSNGFKLYPLTDANWGYMKVKEGPFVAALPAGFVTKFTYHYWAINDASWARTDNDGVDSCVYGLKGANYAGFYLATTAMAGDGYVVGTKGTALTFEFTTLEADHGKILCFGKNEAICAWEWAAASMSDFPVWNNGLDLDEARCWEIFDVPNDPPVWCDPPGNDDSADPFNHCGEGTYTLCATDPDDTGEITYSFALGFDTDFGVVDPVSGVWTWSGLTVPQSGNPDIVFRVWDGKDFALVNFTLHTTITNNAPTIVCPPDPKAVSFGGDPGCQDVEADDGDDCDGDPVITVIDKGGATGVHTVVGNTVCYTPSADDTALVQPIAWVIQADDGDEQVTCDYPMFWTVIVGAPYAVEIAKDSLVLQGHFQDVAITLYKSLGIGGFDFLVAYDASALAFQLAYGGVVYNPDSLGGCGWEYFTYRYGGYGNCGNACPSGILRVIGLAETNDGANHPVCDVPLASFPPVTLAQLRFLVSNDRTLECQYVPIRFFWYDCGDNVISNVDGSEAYLSMKVFDFKDYGSDYRFKERDITWVNDSLSVDPVYVGLDEFPTYRGALEACLFMNPEETKIAKRYVDYQNGGIDIICADKIDNRGDINLNGLEYEIADAVMFTNYFIEGLSAFGTHEEGSIAASDCNADGIPLSVADLVYLIRVVIGDAQPYAKVAPVSARVTYGNDRFNVDVEMGAAHIVMAGDVTPTLLADNMEMRFDSNGEVTNILVYSTEANQSFSGDFLEVNGDVISTEFATFLGAPVVANVMPSTFEVEQNYPNPFNPTTTFKFTVPNGGAWKLGVYNITGQLVESFSGVSELGFETVVWDASNVSSGIYFYRVTTEEHSMTKKAVLLK